MMNPVLRTTILLSLLLHLLIYLIYTGYWADSVTVNSPAKQELTFTLVPEIEPPTPAKQLEPEKPPAPKHLEDNPELANTSDGKAEAGSQSPVRKNRQNEQQDKQQSQSKELISSTRSDHGSVSDDSEEAEQNMDEFRAMESLDDQALDESVVESPLSEQEEEKARWRNEVLKRISEQINFAWVKPFGSQPRHSGILKLELNEDGYLQNAWIHVPSGDPSLDASIIKAVKSVWRFQIPNSKLLNRYYRHLNLTYQGG